jgi:transposase
VLTLKKLQLIPKARNSDKTLEKRREVVLSWINLKGFNFNSTCIFLDEAGFNFHMKRRFGWDPRGKPARAEVKALKGVNITIMGAICELGVVNLTMRSPKLVTCATKTGSKIVKRPGTKAEDFLEFVKSVIDVLDANGMHGRCLIMDNALIYTAETVEAIVSRGYEPMFLPPYSPFLNPIEEFWSKLKAGVRRNKLDKEDSLSPRILESAKHITPQYCQGWIRHSISFFKRCLDLEKNI